MEIRCFPCQCGVLDSSHIILSNPPNNHEDSLISRHHVQSINAMTVIRNSNLWNNFKKGELPFNGAVFFADSAYSCQEWLILPFPGDPDGAQKRFNIAHRKIRNIFDRCFSIVKNRFYALKIRILVDKVEDTYKLIMCGFVIRNLCLRHGDNANDFENGEEEHVMKI
ncbi:putative nuclease HARBI1 [Hydra vulgaris]|uniref:putative nuclease HARBI1 n=1 Tax=Hydra vulgaris TaxID=6087 RepID=UPI001F5F6A06|nr:putative nuclease HARBI1 [Hydra vulgaris]